MALADDERPARDGPLNGLRVIEMAGIGPAPFCGMLLADMGADVIRVDRLRPSGPAVAQLVDPVLNRGRRSIAVDLKKSLGSAAVVRLAGDADVFIESNRPGVAERLGIGPEDLCPPNPKLVYGRMTGWGQDGPLSRTVGHDINYIGLAGALGAIGREGAAPSPPLSLVGDFAAGAMFLLSGILAALLERERSGRGQVIDAAMVDGAMLLMAPFFAMRDLGVWSTERGTNFLDSGAPFYDCYQARDGGWIAVGAIEPEFYQNLLIGLGLDGDDLPAQLDPSGWPSLKKIFADTIASETVSAWMERFRDLEACVSPVLTLDEVAHHPHVVERGSFVSCNGVTQPAPAPRLGRTPGRIRSLGPKAGEHTEEVLAGAGFSESEIAGLLADGAVNLL